MHEQHFNSAVEFGEQLVRTQDLDPVYVAMHCAAIQQGQLYRMVLAYSCLYHLGAAAYLSEFFGSKFWDGLSAAAVNANHDWPRGTERRHWRAKNATSSVHYMRQWFSAPEKVIEHWFQTSKSAGNTFHDVTTRVKEFVGFGPWIAFKIADMGERVLGFPVSFADCELGFYKDPRQGAALVLTGDKDFQVTKVDIYNITTKLGNHLNAKKLKAPPSFNRQLNIQEIETVLCKYKSHVNGHYPLGKDTKEVLHALDGWGDTAQLLQRTLEAQCRKS